MSSRKEQPFSSALLFSNMRTPPPRGSIHTAPFASGSPEIIHANSMSSNIAEKRYYLGKERKRSENEYNEKITKLSNQHKREMDDLVAERTRKFQDLKLQEDDIDYQESQSAALYPHSPVSDRIRSAVPSVEPQVKAEPIYISDDEDTVMTDIKFEKKPSLIVKLNYKHKNVGAVETNNVVKSIERYGRPKYEGSPKKKHKLHLDRTAAASDKLTTVGQHKTSPTKTRFIPTRKCATKSSETSTSKSPVQDIREYFTPTPSIKTTTPASAREGTATLLEEAANTPILSGPRSTRSQAPNYPQSYSGPTPKQRHELATLFVQKATLKLSDHLSHLSPSTCLDAFLQTLDQEIHPPSRFFQYHIDFIDSEYSVHTKCCTSWSRNARPWPTIAKRFLGAEQQRFKRCMESCETMGLDHGERMEWVETRPHLDVHFSDWVIEEGLTLGG